MEPDVLIKAREVISYYTTVKGIEKDEPDKQKKAFENIKTTEFYNLAYRIKESILKQVESKSGVDSDQYKFYFSIFESIVYLTTVLDREDYYKKELHLHKIQLQFYAARVTFLEQQLIKYTTLEDLNRQETAQELLTQLTKQKW